MFSNFETQMEINGNLDVEYILLHQYFGNQWESVGIEM